MHSFLSFVNVNIYQKLSVLMKISLVSGRYPNMVSPGFSNISFVYKMASRRNWMAFKCQVFLVKISQMRSQKHPFKTKY